MSNENVDILKSETSVLVDTTQQRLEFAGAVSATERDWRCRQQHSCSDINRTDLAACWGDDDTQKTPALALPKAAQNIEIRNGLLTSAAAEISLQ